MLKYTDIQVTFREIPDEVTLCINISGCPIRCPDCHSKELWNDIGTDLTPEELLRLIRENNGITCVCLMGGDADIWEVKKLIRVIRDEYEDELAIAWYSGQDEMHPIMLVELDYYKYGSYKKELGGLDSPTTNQRLWQVRRDVGQTIDITSKFWKHDTDTA